MKPEQSVLLDRVRRITRDGRWIPEIDGLRFLAILSVVLFHFFGEFGSRSGQSAPIEPRWLFAIIGNGDRGVRLFFVISGMILAMPFARQYLLQAKKVSLRKYYMRRLTRLEPPYIASILLFTLMTAVYMRGHLWPGYGGHALASLFYMHNLGYGGMSPINPVTWSLEVEIQFYLLAPLAMHLFRIEGATKRRVIMLLGVLAISVAQVPLQIYPRFTGSVLFYFQYFLMGLLLADVFVLDLEVMKSSWLWDVFGLAGLTYMFGAANAWYVTPLLLPFALGAVCLAAMRSLLLRRFVANPWIAVTGGMCYSIYLLHFALIAAFFKLTRRLIVPQFDFLQNYLIQCVAMGVPILLASAVFFRLIERPCMDPDWPSKLWHRVTGRSGNEVEALDTAGIADGEISGVRS